MTGGNMFKRKEHSIVDTGMEEIQQPKVKIPESRSSNTILKGNKLIGDISITCDLELSGDIEGNIVSKTDSNIIIKGSCIGDIETKGGRVEIEGDLVNGNISAGSDVKITGKFNGGEVVSDGKIFLDGEFTGRLEGREIEIGSNAHGKGELFYRENISIARGASVEGRISHAQQELVLLKSPPEEIKLDAGKVKETGSG
jgi:cytoskeletal protein CcmA (bactofilin family)